ncbi:MAG: 50S ribosomal protein L10 [bacterium]
MIRAEKGVLIEEIASKVSQSQAIILLDFNKLKVQEITELRRKLKEVNAEYKVIKNTLLKRAFSKTGTQELADFFIGQTATVFSYTDPVISAKIISKFAFEYKTITVKAGILNGKYIDKLRVNQLSSLPAKEVLLAQVVGSIKWPLIRLCRSLQVPQLKLIQVLNAIKETKK